MTTVIIIVLAVFVCETLLITVLGKCVKQTRKENAALKEEVERQKRNVNALVLHAKELAKIVDDKEKTDHKIQGATNEELTQIITDIINSNNSKLQNPAKG